MGKEKCEYLVNLDVNVIKATIIAAGLNNNYIESKVVFKEEGFIDKCLAEKKMPKATYIMLCDFFRVLYPTFSTDGKYVFAQNHENNTQDVEHVLTATKINVPKYNEENQPKTKSGRKREVIGIVEFDKVELQAKLKASNIKRAEFCINHGKSAGYINSCMQTGRMHESFYNELMKVLNDVRPVVVKKIDSVPVITVPETEDKNILSDADYKAKMKDLIKKTGKTSKDISIECGMGPTYVSYCFSNGKRLNNKVENYIIQLSSINENTVIDDTPEVSRISPKNTKTDDNKVLNMSSESDKNSHSGVNLSESAKTIIPLFNEIVPAQIDLVKISIDGKNYVLVEEDKFNRLVDSLKMSTEILEYISRETQ